MSEALEVVDKKEHYPSVHKWQNRTQELVQTTRMLSVSESRKNGEERTGELKVPSWLTTTGKYMIALKSTYFFYSYKGRSFIPLRTVVHNEGQPQWFIQFQGKKYPEQQFHKHQT